MLSSEHMIAVLTLSSWISPSLPLRGEMQGAPLQSLDPVFLAAAMVTNQAETGIPGQGDVRVRSARDAWTN